MSFLKSGLSAILAPFRLVGRWLARAVSAPRKVMGLSLPMRMALVSALLVLLMLLIDGAIELFADMEEQGWWSGASIGEKIVSLILGFLVVPFSVYKTVQIWSRGDETPFPDLHRAWKQGQEALQKKGIELVDVPCYLVLGAWEGADITALFEASGMRFDVAGAPQAEAPISFYANCDAVYVVCPSAGYLNRLGREAASPAAVQSGPAPSGEPQQGLRGTMIMQDSNDPSEMPAPVAEEFNPSATILVDRATIDIGKLIAQESQQRQQTEGRRHVAKRDAQLESERLRYVCHLLKRDRLPYAPINGILVALDFELVRNTQCDVHVATRSDLEAVRDELELRCPTVALVTGLEQEAGFRELIRRISLERAKRHRFGKGFDVWTPPSDEQMEAVARHACGAFEDWSYELFREEDGLNKDRGNGLLYTLLCHFRGAARERLVQILVHAFSCESKDRDQEPPLFEGVYFAATGESSDQQAFVQSVFQKLLDDDQELEWTHDAIEREIKYHRWTKVAQCASFLLMAWIVYEAAAVVFRG